MANVTISRKPEKNKACVTKQDGKRIRYYCTDKKEYKDYLYDIMYMQDNGMNLAVRILPEKRKFLEYSIAGDRITINEKEIIGDQDPESYIATEYLGEPIEIIKEPIKNIKKLYGPPWYKQKDIIALISMWSLIIIGGGIFFYIKSHKNKTILLKTNQSPPPMGKALTQEQKQSILEGFTKYGLINIAYAIEQTTNIGYPAYISNIDYSIKDEKPAPGKDEKLTGNLSITFRFAYPANGSKLISTDPIPIYSKTTKIVLKPVDVNSYTMDYRTCGMRLLKDGLNLYDVDKMEFKGDIKNYKSFYDFIQTMYYCKGYINSITLTNPNDVLNKKSSANKNSKNSKKTPDIVASVDVFLIK